MGHFRHLLFAQPTQHFGTQLVIQLLKIVNRFHLVRGSHSKSLISTSETQTKKNNKKTFFSEMRQLQQVRVAVPHSLHNHLAQFLSRKSRAEPSLGRNQVYNCTQKPKSRRNNIFLVLCKFHRKLKSRKVALKQNLTQNNSLKQQQKFTKQKLLLR
jgi:hypothetical protein